MNKNENADARIAEGMTFRLLRLGLLRTPIILRPVFMDSSRGWAL